MRVWPGRPFPLGATWDGRGTNFAVASANATTIELVLFDSPESTMEAVCVPLRARTDTVWHAYLPDIRPGQLYGYRVGGAWDPGSGARFSPAKVLLDPYAKAVGRPLTWHPSLLAYQPGSEGQTAEVTDTAPYAPLGAVIDAAFDWRDDQPPATPWHETVIYELHVKGFTAENPQVPEELRGTYLGLATPASIQYLRDLGVTAVELMPVHSHADEPSLVDRGLTNYWGYNSLAYFAPDARYATPGAAQSVVTQFKTMVRTLHEAGLEVILDVVYNHTAEGNHLGPTLSLRGLDNATYYRLDPHDSARYQDFTGCGNTLNMQSPDVLKLLMDSLRYWVQQMHVDGFRFDLASALARELFAVDRLSSFFDVIHQDPIISRVKLIAEPWDVGEGGYQVGNFPAGWAEWNGRYRDAVRRFWRGDPGMLPEFTTRLAGSSDLYGASGRHPHASINFVTAHDGFTVADLVSYAERHNEANGEDNRDGAPENFSWNEGVEGPTEDAAIRERRARQQRNLLFTLLMSVGCRCCRGRRSRPDPTRQQQRLLSGLGALLDALGRGGRRGPARLYARARGVSPVPAGAHAPDVSRRPQARRRRCPLAAGRRAGHDRRRLGRCRAPRRAGAPGRAGAPRSGCARGADRGRHDPARVQQRARRGDRHAPEDNRRGDAVGARARHESSGRPVARPGGRRRLDAAGRGRRGLSPRAVGPSRTEATIRSPSAAARSRP